MAVFPCRLSEPLQLESFYTITPVAIHDDIVELDIAPCEVGRPLWLKRLFELQEQAWELADHQALYPSSHASAPAPPKPTKRKRP
ncbi:hypothetical protein [Microbulbifer discodermiae]|uniref:hypothetical protein n=1 Tax=Microbulbifer sp. 2201CG32-9 TaxID=3232309 RepID=UPI00345B746B